MAMRLERSYRFEAAHSLPRVPPGHKCARMHGHSYQIEVAIEGEVDAERGWVMDFADIDERVAPLVRQLDHQVLNEIEGLTNPTSELLAQWLWHRRDRRVGDRDLALCLSRPLSCVLAARRRCSVPACPRSCASSR
jgi:6-pyruvoyltetrahydropterin/6-carboxytetrahydropterin synthase